MITGMTTRATRVAKTPVMAALLTVPSALTVLLPTRPRPLSTTRLKTQTMTPTKRESSSRAPKRAP
jgi:hypothetical protein